MPRKDLSGPDFPPILYQDSFLVAVNKAPGLLVIPSPKNEKRTLTSLVNAMLDGQNGSTSDGAKAHPCHRLDRDTSGAVLFAIGKAAQQKTMELFHRQVVHKAYIAVVNGVVGKREGSVRDRIEGLEARTDYLVLGATEAFTVLRVSPHTGRTNQIRIHFARMGYPLLGDAKFGIRKDFTVPFKRTALHAWRLELPHPETGESLSIEAPLPEDILTLLAQAGISLHPQMP